MNKLLTVKDLIQQLCDEKGISIYALEKDLGFGHHTIRNWDTARPNSEKLEKVAQFFNVTTDYLLGKEADDETMRIAEELRNSPGKRMLFDSVRDYDEIEIQKVAEFIEMLKGKPE